MKVIETEQSLTIEDIWWGMIILLWTTGLLPLLVIIHYGIASLPFKLVTIPLLLIASGILHQLSAEEADSYIIKLNGE